MAVASNGNIFGAMLAPPLVAALSLRFGWRAGFVVTGAIGLVILVIWWLAYDTPQRSRRITAGERAMLDRDLGRIQPPGERLPMLALLRRPVCASFFVARFMTDSFVFFFTFWLPDYLAHGRGFTLGMIGMVGWLPYLAGDLGGPAGGAASDWLIRRGWKPNRARRSLMLVAACLTPFAALAVATRLDWLALAVIGLVYMAQTCWMANQLTLISESVSRENVATLLSLSALGGSLGGILSTLAIGRVIVAFGYFPVFAGLGALHLAAWLVIAAGFRREEGVSCMPTS
jgi:ACS family hexuronate transporter-like MFS transporter